MASAYIEFFRKFRKEHGSPQTMAGNKALAIAAGKAWQQRRSVTKAAPLTRIERVVRQVRKRIGMETNPRPRRGTDYGAGKQEFFTVFKGGHAIHIPVRPNIKAGRGYDMGVDKWWSKHRNYKTYKRNPLPCPLCHNPVPLMTNSVAVGCDNCGAVLGIG